MKKTVLAIAFLAFSVGVFGQKTWFLSLEETNGTAFKTFYYSQEWGHLEKVSYNHHSLGLGARLFRQSQKFVQPEFGLDFRTTWPQNVELESRNLSGKTFWNFEMIADVGFRIESRPIRKNWRFSAGSGAVLDIPFLTQERFGPNKIWKAELDYFKGGFSYSIGLGKAKKNRRRCDFRASYISLLTRYPKVYIDFFKKGLEKQLVFRFAISIDRVQKGS